MKAHTRHIVTVTLVLVVLAIGLGAFVWSGVYNIGADDPHYKPTNMMLTQLREQSITARSKKLHPPPNLNDPALIRQGAGNYSVMCTGCHLGPGIQETELSRGLYPSPPDFSKLPPGDPAHDFWVIKHGLKATGMPAWGKSMKDEYIWGMTAFLQQLPRLDAEQYQAMVASSGGHAHGGGETAPQGSGAGAMMDESKPHDDPPGAHGGMDMGGNKPADGSKPHVDAPGAPADHHGKPAPAGPTPKPAAGSVEHQHADGTVESHPAPQPPAR